MKNLQPGDLYNKHQKKKKSITSKAQTRANRLILGNPKVDEGTATKAYMIQSGLPLKEANKQFTMVKTPGGVTRNYPKKKIKKAVKTTGKFEGKSNKLGQGGRAAQLKAQGVPGGVIGNLARRAHAAPGQVNFHKKHKMSSAKKCKTCGR